MHKNHQAKYVQLYFTCCNIQNMYYMKQNSIIILKADNNRPIKRVLAKFEKNVSIKVGFQLICGKIHKRI